MNKQTLSLILSIVMLSIVLFLLIFLIREDYLSSIKKFTREKMLKDHEKRIKVSKEKINVNTRTIIYQYFDCKKGHWSQVVTPESNPNYQEVTKYDIDNKQIRIKKSLSIVLNLILIALIGVILGFGIYSQVTKSIYIVNNSTYVTVATSSMASKNKNNTYLESENLNDQIEQFSLIRLDEVSKDDAIEIYGIYAYKNDERELIIHRVIEKTIRENAAYYTFRGDANSLSDYYLVKEDDILFKYDGHKNVPLGYFMSFLGSLVGDVALIYLIIAFLALEYYDSKKSKIVRKDLDLYVNELNWRERKKYNM